MERERLNPHRTVTPASTADETAASTADAAVGYRKPPRHTRFQKGRSGNPTGRRAGSKNGKTLEKEQQTAMTNLLNELVTVDDNGRPRTMTKRQAVVLTVLNHALDGNLAAAREVLREQFERRSEKSAPPSLEEVDELVVKQLYVRIAEMQKGLINGTSEPE
jgi:hypothetical protein